MQYLFLLITSMLFVGCLNSSSMVSGDKIKDELHQDKTKDLRLIMHKLDNLVFEKFNNELERDREKIIHSRNLSKIAQKIAKDSKKLDNFSFKYNFTKSEEFEFVDFANDLSIKAKELEKASDMYDIKKVDESLNNLIKSCNDCHNRFRR